MTTLYLRFECLSSERSRRIGNVSYSVEVVSGEKILHNNRLVGTKSEIKVLARLLARSWGIEKFKLPRIPWAKMKRNHLSRRCPPLSPYHSVLMVKRG